MKRIILFFGLFLLVLTVFAQPRNHSTSVIRKHNPILEVPVDSMKGKDQADEMLRHRRMMRLDTFTLTDFVMSIERVNDKLNAIQDSAQLGVESERFSGEIDDISDNIRLIRQNTRGRRSTISMKSLYLYQSFVTSLKDDNSRIRNRVNILYDRTYNANRLIGTIFRDSVFRALYQNKEMSDSLDRKLRRLERKWSRSDSTLKAGLDTLNSLKVRAADNSMSLSSMLNMMDRKLDKAKPQLLGPEVCFLWQINKAGVVAKDTTQKTISLISSEREAIEYYMKQTSGNKGFILFFGVALFIWFFYKRKLLKTVQSGENNYDFLNLQYLNNYPVMSLLVVLLCLMPFFDAYAPTSYISFVYLLLLAASTVILHKNEDQAFRFYWLALVILFVIEAVTYLLIEPNIVSRLWMLVVQCFIIVFAYRFYKNLRKQRPYYKWIRAAVLIGIILSGLAILCNLFGRFSLSGLLGLSSIFAITQAIILTIFIDTILEIIVLQLLSSRLRKGVDQSFDSNVVIKKLKLPLIIITVLLWIILLTSNLNLYHDISNYVFKSLTMIRTFGSFSFKLINVFWFILIIWTAHILEKLIGFLFGETGNDMEDATYETKGQHSRLLILRLLVILGGYLLAIAASGLPLDKLTIIIGALGVGIGMGLQNVVNNFVSGIVLIFDGSLQIGDDIEISGQAGKVKEIGMRSSTLSTPDGAEVIIPNGTILSQNIVNWTFTNDQKRIALNFNLSGKELDANLINEVINITISNTPNVITKRKPIILYTKVTEGSYTLTVYLWSTIKKSEQVRSETLLNLNAAFTAKNIGFDVTATMKVMVTK